MLQQARETLVTPGAAALGLSADGPELHKRLIRYSCEDFIYEPSVQRPSLFIVGDHRVAIKGVTLALNTARVFVLNNLRLTQGFGVDSEELLAKGFGGDPRSLDSTVRSLVSIMNELGGDQLYVDQTTGNDGRLEVTLMPEVAVVDLRDQAAPIEYTQQALAEGVVRNEAGRIALLESGGINFVAPRHRAAMTLAMIRDFGAWAQIDNTLEHALFGRTGYRAESPILPMDFLEELSREQEDILLAEKEQALLQYMELSAFPSRSELDVIVEGINAYYELFAHSLRLVHVLAWGSCRKVPYADLYQEGAAQVLDAALHTGLDYDRPVSFRTIAYNNIRKQKRRGIVPLYYDSVLPPGTFPYSQVASLHAFNRRLEDIKDAQGQLPNVSSLSAQLHMGRDTILGFMSVGRDVVCLDDLERGGEASAEDASLIGEDFAESVVANLNSQAMVEAIFNKVELTDNQKIVLSLYYGIYSADLPGTAIYKQDSVVFVYPGCQEDFEALLDKKLDLSAIGVQIFKDHQETARRLHDTAMVKVRQFLLDHPEFDISGRIDHKQVERQQFIDAALLVSPHKRLGAREIRKHFGAAGLPGGEDAIRKLFGSVSAFQQACGFEPDRGQNNATLTDEEIIAWAQQLQSDKPLRTGQIRALSKQQAFVSLQAILGRWKSLPEFQRACGFEV